MIALCYVAAASCAQVTDDAETGVAATPAMATVPPAVASSPSMAAEAGASVAARPPSVPSNREQASIDAPSGETDAGLPPPSVATEDLPLPAIERPSFEPAATPPREAERSPDPVVSSLSSPPATETLDVSTLLTRLRKTKAINLRTKLAVKNESDDLMERFREYHAQDGTAKTLAELRGSYDSLFRRLYSLLEDDDPPLAREIDRSRAAIWAILADPVRFGSAVRIASTRRVPTA
jgi:hypothetical protein